MMNFIININCHLATTYLSNLLADNRSIVLGIYFGYNGIVICRNKANRLTSILSRFVNRNNNTTAEEERMARGRKYAPLTIWLQECSKDIVRLSFEELKDIIAIPYYAYMDRPSWANCTTPSATPFQRSWMGAGYVVGAISLPEQWVEFKKSGITITASRQTAAATRVQHSAIPKTTKEELLLTVPSNLTALEQDKYLLVCLNKHNSDIVEDCITKDLAYQSKGKALMELHFKAGDYSKAAYYAVINRIATENATRTPKKAMECLAVYCAAINNRFLDRIKNGDQELVDDMLQHLVENNCRQDKSLVSKVCRYLNEWLYDGCAYTINDSIVRAIMPYYLAYYKIDSKLWVGKNFGKLSYVEFYRIFSALRAKVPELNNHQLDHLIWYAYKNDSIRSEVAKALAQVLNSDKERVYFK